MKFYEAGAYDAARVEFEACYALSNVPDILYNLTLTAEKQGKLADAIGYAERYLAAQKDAPDTAAVKERIARLRQQLGGQSAPAAEGDKTQPTAPAAPAGGDSPAVPAPTVAPVDVSPAPARPSAKPALALLGSGAVLLLAGIGTGAGALVTAKEIEGMEAGIWYSDLLSLQRRGMALEATSISLSVVGGIAVVVGGGWVLWQARRKVNSSQ